MHRSHFLGKKKTFALYDCCDFFKMRQKGVSVRPLPTKKNSFDFTYTFWGWIGMGIYPIYIFCLQKCPIATTLMAIVLVVAVVLYLFSPCFSMLQ